jgi:hypothetical protein
MREKRGIMRIPFLDDRIETATKGVEQDFQEQLDKLEETHKEEVGQLTQRFAATRRELSVQRARGARLAKANIERRGGVGIGRSNSYQLHDELVGIWRIHPWTRSAIGTIGRSLVGPGFEIVPRDEKTGKADQDNLQVILDYFYPPHKRWTSIKDFVTGPAKIYLTAVYLKIFGQAAWEQSRDGFGRLHGFDFVFGKVQPNYDFKGKFLEPAWYQYSRAGAVEYQYPDDLVYFVSPDIEGYMTGSSDLEAATATTLTSDLLAGLANQSMIENISSPDGLFMVDRDISDPLWEEVQDEIHNLYSGPSNFGRPMVAARGLVDFKPYAQQRDMQWGESRLFNREEISAATGAYTGILGLMEGLSRANLMAVARQFWATTNKPLAKLIENTIDEQVIQRDLGIDDWVFRFKPPEFQTEGEQVYDSIRRVTHGISTPNQEAVRYGNPTFPGGDIRLVPKNMRILGEEPPTSDGDEAWGTHPLQGRPPGDPAGQSQKGEFQEEREELANWQKISKAMVRDGDFPITKRRFQARALPSEWVDYGHWRLEKASTLQEVEEVFDDLFARYR